MLFGIEVGLQALWFAEAIGVVEESEFVLGLEHTTACGVDVGL